MTNKIFDLNKSFDFNILKLGNPNLINNNNYFSKVTHGIGDKNLYIQLPKCCTKQGIIRGSNKSQCELCYSINEKNVIEFLENLEKYCIEEIYNNKELWFYNSKNITFDDIEELMTPLIKTYKHGKNFLIKNLVKPDKLNIYDENENKIDIDEYNISHEFLPLINISGVKFSNKNLTIEINLTQMLVLYPSDEFEKEILIKVNKNEYNMNTLEKTQENKEKLEATKEEEEKLEKQEEAEENKEKLEKLEKEEARKEEKLEKEEARKEEKLEEEEEEKLEEEEEEEEEEEARENLETTKEEEATKKLEEATKKLEAATKLKAEEKSEKLELEETHINSLIIKDINEDNPFEIKSRDEIYLEVYNKAKKKAKEIRKNAIQAFLEAKNIKTKYNLESLIDSDTSEEEEFL